MVCIAVRKPIEDADTDLPCGECGSQKMCSRSTCNRFGYGSMRWLTIRYQGSGRVQDGPARLVEFNSVGGPFFWPAASGTAAGALYVFGGRDAAGNAVATTQIYDIATNTWGLGASMPTPRSNGMAGLIDLGAAEDGQIAVFGGADPFFTNLAVTELYDPSTNTSSPGPNRVVPASEFAVGELRDSTGVYSIGEGILNAAQNSVQRLTMVPEPSSFLLVAIGLLSLGLIGCRRRRQA